MIENKNIYVGNRYVPKIMGEWHSQQPYEGLSIVTFEGTSYTSKKGVPIGVNILNEDYWIVTGNYNAQIENYRQEVKKNSEDLTDYKVEVTTQLADITNKSVLTIEKMGLKDKVSLNDINNKSFENVILNFENKEFTLDGNLVLNLKNCVVLNLNVKVKGYNSFKTIGSSYSFYHCVFDGILANKDYFNKPDAGTNLFMAVSLEGNNISFEMNEIKNFVSRQGLMIKNSDTFSVKNNRVLNCWSYNRISHTLGGFDNYGDGIYILNSNNGSVEYNKVNNSTTNPIGRCGIVVEFDCYQVNVSNNSISGYDRGVHVELIKDDIDIFNNTITACNVPLMIWNVGLARVSVEDNYASNEGLDYTRAEHKTILESRIARICVLGDYREDYKNNSNVLVKNNQLINAINSIYNDHIYVENGFHIVFRGNTLENNNTIESTVFSAGDDNGSRTYYLDFEDNTLKGNIFLDVLFHDFINLKNNTIPKLRFMSKSSANRTLIGKQYRVIKNNIVLDTFSSGSSIFAGYQDSIITDNTFVNAKCDWIISGDGSCIFSGNTFIRTKTDSGVLNLNLVKTSVRFAGDEVNARAKYYSTHPNLFIDDVENVAFNWNANDTEAV